MKLLALLSLFVLTISCASSPDKNQLALFNKKLHEQKLGSVLDLGPSTLKRMPLKEGQWVTVYTVMKEGNKDVALSTFKVLGVDGKSVLMEVETTSASAPGPSVIQYEIENYAGFNKINPTKAELEKFVDKLNIKKVFTKNGNDKVRELPATLLPKKMLKDILASGYMIGTHSKESCASNYLKGTNCVVFDFEASAYGFTTKGKSFAHSGVPIMGFIKTDSDKASSFVVNFGMKGATSSL